MKFDRQRFVDDLITLTERDVKWLHQGRDPDVGVDCIGLPRWAYRNQGLNLPEQLDREFDSYHHRPDGVRMLRVLRQWLEELTLEAAQPGDLILFYQWKNPQHMAVLVGPNEIVEAFKNGHISKVLKQPLDPRRRIAGVFRIPDFEVI